MAFTQAADTRAVATPPGEPEKRVELTQSEKDAENARREKNDVKRQKRQGFKSEAVTRASTINSNYDSVEDLNNLRENRALALSIGGQSEADVLAIADYYLNTATERLDELSLSDLKDVDPAADDPFSATPIDPGPWPV